MEEGYAEGRDMTPERLVKILEKYEEIVTIQQAEKMLKMINLLAGIAVDQYLRSTNS